MLPRLRLKIYHLQTRSLSNFPSLFHRTMSTFQLPDISPAVLVKLPPDLSQDQLLSFPAFKTWLSTLQHSLSLQTKASHAFHKSPYCLRAITVQACDFFGGGRLGFLKFTAEISNDKGQKLPGAIFLRGGSVAMLLILTPQDAADANEEYVILTVQPRIPAASLSFVELPAGMLDNSGTFAGAAAKEIREETGLEIEEKDILDMTSLLLTTQEGESAENGEELQKAIYPSPGGSDEHIPLFLSRKTMPRADIEAMKGKLTGLRKEGENIVLRICRLDQLWKIGARDGKTMAAVAVYDGLKRDGKI